MRKFLLLALLLAGCTAVPVGNKGLETRDVGFQPHDIATAKAAKDINTTVNLTLNFSRQAFTKPFGILKNLLFRRK